MKFHLILRLASVGALASIGLLGFSTTSALATVGGNPVIYNSLVGGIL